MERFHDYENSSNPRLVDACRLSRFDTGSGTISPAIDAPDRSATDKHAADQTGASAVLRASGASSSRRTVHDRSRTGATG